MAPQVQFQDSQCEIYGRYIIFKSFLDKFFITHKECGRLGQQAYCKVNGQNVAKKRLGKELNNRGTVFCGVRATIAAMQWFGKQVSNMEDGVFRGIRAKVFLKIDCATVQS
jgi:hypothetical protein